MSMERDALMREVDEEVRRDQLKKLWDAYGTYVVAAVVLFVAGVGGYKWWDGQRIAAAQASGLRFEQAMDLAAAGKADEAQKEFAAIAAGQRTGYQLLAQLTVAGVAAKAGKTEEAFAAYESVASRATDPLLKDFARLQAASLKIDSADWTEMQNRLNQLIGEKSPWRHTARELLGISALRLGKLDEARQTLGPLSADPRAPAAIRERSGALMSLVVAADLEKTAPAKVELEKTDPPAGAADATPAKPPVKSAPSRGNVPKK